MTKKKATKKSAKKPTRKSVKKPKSAGVAVKHLSTSAKSPRGEKRYVKMLFLPRAVRQPLRTLARRLGMSDNQLITDATLRYMADPSVGQAVEVRAKALRG